MEELWLQHDHPVGSATKYSRRSLRSGADRRRFGMAAVLAHHLAGPAAGAVAGELADHDRLFSVVRRAVCDDGRRSAAEYAERVVFHVRRRVQMVEPGA